MTQSKCVENDVIKIRQCPVCEDWPEDNGQWCSLTSQCTNDIWKLFTCPLTCGSEHCEHITTLDPTRHPTPVPTTSNPTLSCDCFISFGATICHPPNCEDFLEYCECDEQKGVQLQFQHDHVC